MLQHNIMIIFAKEEKTPDISTELSMGQPLRESSMALRPSSLKKHQCVQISTTVNFAERDLHPDSIYNVSSLFIQQH